MITFDWYLFLLIELFFKNPISIAAIVFHYLELIKLQQSFVSVIANVVAFVSLDNTHLSDQVKKRSISQLINGISRVLPQLLKHFNGTIISTSFLPLAASALPVICYLNLSEALLLAAWNLAIATALVKAGSSL